jgi:phosphate transport system permease protein
MSDKQTIPVDNPLFYDEQVKKRYRANRDWNIIFLASTSFGVVMLIILLLNIVNGAFGLIAIENEVQPETIFYEDVAYEDMNTSQLAGLLGQELSRGLIRGIENRRGKPISEFSEKEMRAIVEEEIINSEVIKSWDLINSVFNSQSARDFIETEAPQAELKFQAWLNPAFLTAPQSSVPEDAGIRRAILGSLWMVIITFLFAFPIGIGAAIYLEEYAEDNRLNRLIQTNIYNLAGVPSIIYGLLGLAIFVRFLGPITSGQIFGFTTQNGRTVLSAGLTLGLLILPIIIINAQEAFKALPNSLRLSSYGLGATKWQTIWHHLLPNVLDRIMTGTIIAISRAIGETAPLVVIGASTFINEDPSSIFSKFTTLPIQIYQWSARPQPEFRHIAAAAIIVLLIVLLSMNTAAILMRDRFSRKKRLGR